MAGLLSDTVVHSRLCLDPRVFRENISVRIICDT